MQFRLLSPEGRAARRSETAVVSAPGSPPSLVGSFLHRESYTLLPRVVREPLWSLGVPVTGDIVIDVSCEGKKDLRRGGPGETGSGQLCTHCFFKLTHTVSLAVCVCLCSVVSDSLQPHGL